MITCVYVAIKLRAQLLITFGLISLQNYIKKYVSGGSIPLSLKL